MNNDLINFFFHIPTWYFTILTALFGAFSGLCIYAGKRYFAASEEFQAIVRAKLEGIYPNTAAFLSIEDKDLRTQSSINPINSAGAKFSDYLPFLCVSPFNRALNTYCETARKTYWDQDVAFERFRESMAKPGELSPGEKFRAAVDELLKFAK